MALLAGVVVFFVMVALAVGSYFEYFIDFPALIVVLVPTLGFVATAASAKGMSSAFGLAFSSRAPAADEARSAIAALSLFGELAAAMGVLGMLIGAVLILQNLSDPAALGPALAVALLTLFYGVIIKLLCYAGQQRIAHRSGA